MEPKQMTEEELKQLRQDSYDGIHTPDTAADESDDAQTGTEGQQIPEKEPADEGSQNADDAMAGIPPALVAQLSEISSKVSGITTIEERLKQVERRTGSIQNELFNAKKTADEMKKQDIEAPSQKQIEAAAKSQALWSEMEAEYPEWAAALEARFELERTKNQTPDITGIKSKMESLSTTLDGLKGSAVTPQVLLSFFHPKWQEDVKSSEYQEWLKQQPENIRMKHFSDDVSDAHEVLTLFKAFRQQSEKTKQDDIVAARKNRLKSSVEVPGGQRQKPSISDADLSEAEFRKRESQKIWGT